MKKYSQHDHQEPKLQDVGRLGLEALYPGLRSLTPLLRQSGYDDGRIAWLMVRLHKELSTQVVGCGTGPAWLINYLWARKGGEV